MPRLTLDLIQRSKQELNPNKDRQLTLRGNKIEVIENLGASQDHFTCIDLSENGIMKLGSIPILSRLQTLMLANNYIKRIDPKVFDGTPNLVSLVLTNNKLSILRDIDPLGKMKNLERLSLIGNPMTKLPNYRMYVIWAMRNTKLRVLDFTRILDVERKKAEKMFSGPEGAELLAKIAPKRISAEEAEKEKMDTLDTSAVERIKQAITEATTLEEVTRLEKALKDGKLSAEDLEELLKPQSVRDKEEKEREEQERKEEEEREKAEKEKEGSGSSSSPASSPASAGLAAVPVAATESVTKPDGIASPKRKSVSRSRSRSRKSSPSRSRSRSRSEKKSRKSGDSGKKSPKSAKKGRRESESESESEEKKRKIKAQEGESESESDAPSAKKTKKDD